MAQGSRIQGFLQVADPATMAACERHVAAVDTDGSCEKGFHCSMHLRCPLWEQMGFSPVIPSIRTWVDNVNI